MFTSPRWREWYEWHRPMAVFAMTMGVLVVVAAVGVLFDDRYLAGAPVWLKPLKFGISFLVYAVSLGWILATMHRQRPSLGVMAVGTALAVSSFLEVVMITVQAARAQESHFNAQATAIDTVIARGMILMVLTLWVTSVIIAIVALRRRFGDRAFTSAIRLGLILMVFGAALGALMVLPTAAQQAAAADGATTLIGAHGVGVPHGGPGMPITGWSANGGDLRIPHFIGIHALQALPLLVALLSRQRLALTETTQVRLVRLGAAGYLGLVLITLVQALRAQPLLSPDGWTLAAVTLLAIGIAAGTAHTLRGERLPHGETVRIPSSV